MNATKFIMKSFFGGFFGCLGVLSLMVIFVLIIGLVFGQQLIGGTSSILESIPSILTQGQNLPLFGDGNITGENLNDKQSMTPMGPYVGAPIEVFLTMGNKPDGKRVISFTREESKQVSFWARSSESTPVQFEVLITMPDNSQTQFGPTFTTDPSGNPVNCGQFGVANPSAGSYRLEAIPLGSSSAAGVFDFTITE